MFGVKNRYFGKFFLENRIKIIFCEGLSSPPLFELPAMVPDDLPLTVTQWILRGGR
jgi:hypothetical protein